MPAKKVDWKIRYVQKVKVPKKLIRKSGRLFRVPDYERCWPWDASKQDRGYGNFWKDGRTQPATRCGWEYWHGSPPAPELFVCHRCDNPACHNPKHWFLGTASENIIDKVQKGRGKTPNGSRHWKHKLSEEEVLAIRAEHSGKYGENARLGRKYGVSRETIRGIIRGVEWHHLK